MLEDRTRSLKDRPTLGLLTHGGIDTQGVFGTGAPQQVREDVKRRVADLMPGGSFVFNTVHNIQGSVPPENIMAMWETLQEFGVYHQ